MDTRFLIAACFTLAAVPALAQSNTANEGAAAPDGTYSAPMTPPADQTQHKQTQRQANSDPYNMPQNRDAHATQSSEPSSQQNSEASGNGQAQTDADSTTPSERTPPP